MTQNESMAMFGFGGCSTFHKSGGQLCTASLFSPGHWHGTANVKTGPCIRTIADPSTFVSKLSICSTGGKSNSFS